MANENAVFRRNGDKIDYSCTGKVAAGDIIKLPCGLVGVAEVGGAAGDVIALTMRGVFELNSTGAIAQGALVYLTSEGKATATKETNTLIGTAWAAAAAGSTRALVAINVGIEAVSA